MRTFSRARMRAPGARDATESGAGPAGPLVRPCGQDVITPRCFSPVCLAGRRSGKRQRGHGGCIFILFFFAQPFRTRRRARRPTSPTLWSRRDHAEVLFPRVPRWTTLRQAAAGSRGVHFLLFFFSTWQVGNGLSSGRGLRLYSSMRPRQPRRCNCLARRSSAMIGPAQRRLQRQVLIRIFPFCKWACFRRSRYQSNPMPL